MSIRESAVTVGFKTLRAIGIVKGNGTAEATKKHPMEKTGLDTSVFSRERQKDSGDDSLPTTATSSGVDDVKENVRHARAEERTGLRRRDQHYSWREVYRELEVDDWGHE